MPWKEATDNHTTDLLTSGGRSKHSCSSCFAFFGGRGKPSCSSCLLFFGGWGKRSCWSCFVTFGGRGKRSCSSCLVLDASAPHYPDPISPARERLIGADTSWGSGFSLRDVVLIAILSRFQQKPNSNRRPSRCLQDTFKIHAEAFQHTFKILSEYPHNTFGLRNTFKISSEYLQISFKVPSEHLQNIFIIPA